MAGRGRPTYLKRQREAARQRRKMDKAEKRAQRKEDKDATVSTSPPDVDPDLAGIEHGPQRQRDPVDVVALRRLRRSSGAPRSRRRRRRARLTRRRLSLPDR